MMMMMIIIMMTKTAIMILGKFFMIILVTTINKVQAAGVDTRRVAAESEKNPFWIATHIFQSPLIHFNQF